MSAKTSNSSNGDEDNHDKPTNATLAAKARVRGNDLLAYGQRQVDRVVSPATRQKAIDSTTAFASSRPLLSVCHCHIATISLSTMSMSFSIPVAHHTG